MLLCPPFPPRPPFPPAAPTQLDALSAAGLPVTPGYSALDAARELLRHAKSKGLPETAATASQLARMKELQLIGEGGGTAAATATGGERGRDGGPMGLCLAYVLANALVCTGILG
jgi:hypothetical protein